MVRELRDDDIYEVAKMYKAMAKELWKDLAVDDDNVYQREILSFQTLYKTKILVDDKLRGFFIVRDETNPITPKRKIYNGIVVYIKPEYRHTKLLKEFYDVLFKLYPDGEIWGVTEYHSEHNKVLLKRHTPVAIVYKLKRS